MGDAERPCSCLPEAVARYRARVSGPLLDRIDLRVHVPRVPYERLRAHLAGGPSGEASAAVRERVVSARARMRARGAGARTNAELSAADVRRVCALESDAEGVMAAGMRGGRYSARGYHRLLRVARTIADLEGAPRIRTGDLSLALLLRAEP